MTDASTLRDMILSGRLPRTQPQRTWGGPGVGAACMVCGRHIGAHELEFEVEFAAPIVATECVVVHVHIPCFDAWQRELANLPPALSLPTGAGTLRDGEHVGRDAGGSG